MSTIIAHFKKSSYSLPHGTVKAGVTAKSSTLQYPSEASVISHSHDGKAHDIYDHSEHPGDDEACGYYEKSLIVRIARKARIESLHPDKSEDKDTEDRVYGAEGGISVSLERIGIDGIDTVDDIEKRGAAHSYHPVLYGNRISVTDDKAEPEASRKIGQHAYTSTNKNAKDKAEIK